jgi:peptide/nickel transport system ATP-binding protein
LLQAIPKITGKAKERLVAIEGGIPSPFERVTGCPFHPRCSQVIQGVCNVQIPKATDFGNGHSAVCHLYP